MLRITGALCALVLAVASVSSASAAVVTFDAQIEYSGATAPAGAAPWLRATFDDGGSSGSVTLTLTALNLTGTEFVNKWMFNLDPALDPADLTFSTPTKVGTFSDPVLAAGVDAFIAAGDTRFDVQFQFDLAPPTDRFGAADSITYTISGIPSLTANSFNSLSTQGGQGPFLMAAHVLAIGVDDSGWVTVPEPSSALLLAVLAGAMATRRRRA